MFDRTSSEPLEIIRANEAAGEAVSLTTKRFRRLFNEIDARDAKIERLLAALRPIIETAAAIEGDAQHVKVRRELIGAARVVVVEQRAAKSE